MMKYAITICLTQLQRMASGGTGKKFDWKLISKSKIEKPFFLSGGIGVDDVA